MRRGPPPHTRRAVLLLVTSAPDGIGVAEVAQRLGITRKAAQTHLDRLGPLVVCAQRGTWARWCAPGREAAAIEAAAAMAAAARKPSPVVVRKVAVVALGPRSVFELGAV